MQTVRAQDPVPAENSGAKLFGSISMPRKERNYTFKGISLSQSPEEKGAVITDCWQSHHEVYFMVVFFISIIHVVFFISIIQFCSFKYRLSAYEWENTSDWEHRRDVISHPSRASWVQEKCLLFELVPYSCCQQVAETFLVFNQTWHFAITPASRDGVIVGCWCEQVIWDAL